MHVGQATALQARPEARQPLLVDIECIQAAAGTHQRAERKRLATGAGTEVDHHLAPPRLHQPRDELAALVLHLHAPFAVHRPLRETRLACETDRIGRIPSCGRSDVMRCEFFEHLIALCLQRVDPQIERCSGLQRLDQFGGIRVLLAEFQKEPVRQFGADRCRRLREIDRQRMLDRTCISPEGALVQRV